MTPRVVLSKLIKGREASKPNMTQGSYSFKNQREGVSLRDPGWQPEQKSQPLPLACRRGSPRQLRRPQPRIFQHRFCCVLEPAHTPQGTAAQPELPAKARSSAPTCSHSDRELRELVLRPSLSDVLTLRVSSTQRSYPGSV